MNSTPYATASDIPGEVRARVVLLLNQQLVDAIDLGLQLKHAHWNVKGPGFISLHELFDELAEEVEEFIDNMAERAVELGGIAAGTVQAVAQSTRLPAYPVAIAAGRDHCRSLQRTLASLAASTRAAIDIASNMGEADTADLFTGVSRGIDKMLWKIEAHLQAED
jgi:starvation-inducible DNA-binding protein